MHTDTSLIVAALMAVFTILFGVRNVQASEQHRGMMLAIAFESVVKLLALLTVGPFVLFVLFDGPADLLAQVESVPAIADRLIREGSPLTWVVTTLLSAMAFLCLPRQFHVAVVEHDHPASLRTARWLFPLYLVLINLFVVPIAAAGLLLLGPQTSPDLYVLQLPLANGESWLSAFVFIGGLSAATSMVIVACMALSGMIGNELVMPYLLRRQAGRRARHGPAGGVRAPRRRRAHPDGGLRLRAHHLGLPAARLDRPDQLLRRRQLRARRWCSASTGGAPIATAWWRAWPAASSSGSTRCCCRPCARPRAAARWRR